jgi:anti-sigma B factor antagonist
MNLRTDEGRGKVTVWVSGEIDMAGQQQLTEALCKAAAVAACGQVLVDLSQTSFIDSSGLAALIDGMRAAQQAGATYRVTGTAGLVRQVLEVTGTLGALTGETAGPK